MEDSPQNVPEPWRRAPRRGLQRLRAGEFEAAEAHFSRAYSWAPTQADVCYGLGRERLRRGDVDEGERLLSTAWAADRSLVSAAASLARSYVQHGGRFQAAHELLADAMTDGGGLDALLIVRAEILIEQGRIVEARTTAESGLEHATTETTITAARAALARVHNQEGIADANGEHYERALFCFKRAADHDPTWSSPHVNIGACFTNLNKPRRALAAYRNAVELEPDNPLAHYDMGLLHFELGDAAAARASLALAVSADESNSDAWAALGVALMAEGDRDGAETCYRQSLDLNPDHEQACTRLADLLARDARYIEAALLAERASEIANRKRRRS